MGLWPGVKSSLSQKETRPRRTPKLIWLCARKSANSPLERIASWSVAPAPVRSQPKLEVEPRGHRYARIDQRDLRAGREVAHRERRRTDVEGSAMVVGVEQAHGVSRVQRTLVVEGADQRVPALDRDIAPAAPVLRQLPLQRGPGGNASGPGRLEPRRERVGLLVQDLARLDRAALQRHRLVPGVGEA